MVIVIGNGLGDQGSNPAGGCLHLIGRNDKIVALEKTT